MNRILFVILLLGFFGCDTKDNIKPLGDDFFIKFYGSLGDQEGVSVKSTPDGGFIIGGNSVETFGGQSDYLLIKVDAFGNQEWLQTYDYNGVGEDDFITDVLVDGNDYILAGTSGIESKMVVMRIDPVGQMVEQIAIDPFQGTETVGQTSLFKCNGISQTSTGDFMVVGPIVNNNTNQAGKSLFSLLPNDLLNPQNELYPANSSTTEKLVFVKGVEVVNPDSKYLIAANVENGPDSKIRLMQINEDFETPGSAGQTNFNNSKTVDMVKIADNNYWMLSSTETETYIIGIGVGSSNDFEFNKDERILSDQFFKGVSLNYTANEQFIVSSNLSQDITTTTASSIVETKATGVINWQRIFGTELSYKSGEVISLNDGSIVYTGTAGLKDQNKVFLIKLKSNGEMK